MTDRFARRCALQPERSHNRTRAGVLRRTIFAASVLIAMLLAGGSAQPTHAASGVISSVNLFKVLDRVEGVPIPMPYLVELCVSGPAIADATVTVNGGAEQTMSPVGATEFCLEQQFANSVDLDSAFPVGIYVVSVTDTSGGSDSATVNFQATEPTAFPAFVFPAAPGNLPAGADLPVTWLLTDKGSCDTNSPEACLDGFQLFVADPATDTDVHSKKMTPVSNGTLVPGDVLLAGVSYDLELETFRGTVGSTLSTSMGDTVPFEAIFEDINFISISAVVPTVISSVALFKSVDRFGGVLLAMPYFAEFCVQGPALQSATLVAAGGGTPVAMAQVDPTEFCLETPFATSGELDAAFPAGNFTIAATDLSSATDSVTVNFSATEPSAFLDFVSPVDGGVISSQSDLPVSWTMNGCPGAPSSCADGLLFALGDNVLDEDVDLQLMVPHATATTVSAGVLAPDTSYTLELETYNGTLVTPALTAQGTSIAAIAIYESINIIQVPEPSAALQSGAALAALGLLVAARSRSRASSFG